MGQDYDNDDCHDGYDSGHGHGCDDPNEPYSWFEGSSQGGTTNNYYGSRGGSGRGNRYGGSGSGCLLLIAMPFAVATAIFYGFDLVR